MASKKYTDEELNYFRVCYVFTHIVPDGLRTVFKYEWDNHYKATHGQWRDTARNATDFYNMESPRTRKRNVRLLAIMANGDTSEWDCTCLFYAILYSDSLGPFLNTAVKNSVDDLRDIRNKVFAHSTDGRLTEVDFQAYIQNILTAFTILKLNPVAVEEIKNEKSFLTQELEIEQKRNAEWNSFCVLPSKPSHDTTGRLDEVTAICEEMETLMNTKKNELTVIYLSGNPGCGKSEVARQIGHKYFNDMPTETRFVVTLNASSIDTLLQSYVEFAGRLRCDEDSVTRISTSKELNKDEKIKHIRALIDVRVQKCSSWLMIVDNVVDLKSVSKYLPQAGEKTNGKGQVLVTTQDRQSVPCDSYTYHLSLSLGMKHNDAIALLCSISGLEGEEEKILKVAKALDFQPLALACAAVYMQRICSGTGNLNIWEEYLQKLKDGKREATETLYKKTSLTYPTTMTAAVRLALEREASEDKIMMHAFQFLSIIANEPIPLEYVVQYVMKCMPDEDQALLAVNITSSSLVNSSMEESKEICLHQVVYYCLENVISENSAKETDVFDVVSAFSNVTSFNLDKTRDIIETRSLVPHFVAISTTLLRFIELEHRPIFIRNHSLSIKFVLVAKCLSKIGGICLLHGSFQASNTCFQIVLMIEQETVHDDKDPTLALTLNNLGNSYRDLGQYEKAKACLERALIIQSSAYNEEHPSVASTLSNLAITIRELGHFEQAKGYLQRALAIQERLYDANHPALSAILNNLGCTFRDLAQYKESTLYLERSLVIEEKVRGESHPNVAIRLNNLAITLQRLGQFEKAKECTERALSIDECVYDKKHPFIAVRLRNLASDFHALGQYDKAKRCLERSLAIDEKNLGATHPSLANSLNTLGTILRDMGQYKEAKLCLERALAIEECAYDTGHPMFAVTLNRLGITLHDLGHFKEAKTCLEKAICIYNSLNHDKHPESAVVLSNLGITHPESLLANSLNTLGTILRDMGQYKEAKLCLERALAIEECAYDTGHPMFAVTLNNLGITLHDLGHFKEAKTCLEKAIFICNSLNHDKHPVSAVALSNLGITLRDLGQYQQAKAYLSQALSVQENANDEEHPCIYMVNTLNNLGKTFHSMSQYVEAKACFERGLAIQNRVFNTNHPKTAITLCNLGNTLRAMGQYEEAETYLEKAIAIQQSLLDEDNIFLAVTFDNLAKTVNEMGQNEQAEFFSKKALREVHENADYANHPFLAEALNTRAKILLDLGEYEESRTCLARALCIQEQVYDEKHPLMAVTLNNIESLRKLGHKEEAKSCLHRARAIEKAHTPAPAHTRRCLVS